MPEYTADLGLKASVVSSDSAYSLNLVANGYATTAKNTFVIISDKIRIAVVNIVLGGFAYVLIRIAAVLQSELLKFAVCGSYARHTLLLVIGKNKFERDLSGSNYLRSIGEHFHTLFYFYKASGLKVFSSGNFYYAHTARTLIGYVLKVAKRGNIYTDSLSGVQNSGAGRNGNGYSVYLQIYHIHDLISYFLLIALNLQLAIQAPHLIHLSVSIFMDASLCPGAT